MLRGTDYAVVNHARNRSHSQPINHSRSNSNTTVTVNGKPKAKTSDLVKHQRARREADSALVGIGFAAVLAPVTHGTTLFGLLFSVPKFIYYTKKKGKYRKRLHQAGLKPVARTKTDYFVPLGFGAISGVVGAVIPGLEGAGHALHGLEHAANAVAGGHQHIAQLANMAPGGVEKLAEWVGRPIAEGAVDRAMDARRNRRKAAIEANTRGGVSRGKDREDDDFWIPDEKDFEHQYQYEYDYEDEHKYEGEHKFEYEDEHKYEYEYDYDDGEDDYEMYGLDDNHGQQEQGQPDILHEGIRENLLNWNPRDQDIDDDDEDNLENYMGLNVDEMLAAIDHLDELIQKAMKETFDEREMAIIRGHLTMDAIGEVMSSVLRSAEYQGIAKDGGAHLQEYFHQMVLSSTNSIRRQKQIVLSIGNKGMSFSDMGYAESGSKSDNGSNKLAIHYGIPCNACDDLEIEGPRYNCNDCSEEVNFCFECFMSDEYEDHTLQHKWTEFQTSSYTTMKSPESEKGPQTPLDDTVCFVCGDMVAGDRFKCRGCDCFDVCRGCFTRDGKTLHETHTFALITPFGFSAVDRDEFFGP